MRFQIRMLAHGICSLLDQDFLFHILRRGAGPAGIDPITRTSNRESSARDTSAASTPSTQISEQRRRTMMPVTNDALEHLIGYLRSMRTVSPSLSTRPAHGPPGHPTKIRRPAQPDHPGCGSPRSSACGALIRPGRETDPQGGLPSEIEYRIARTESPGHCGQLDAEPGRTCRESVDQESSWSTDASKNCAGGRIIDRHRA